MTTVYLNGRYLPLAEATVSVLDRGFIFGDGVYEYIRVYAGRPFALRQHLDRLDRSLAGLQLPWPVPRPELETICHELIVRNQQPESGIYLQVTRGAAPRSHAFPKHSTPTLFVMIDEVPPRPPEWDETGVSIITTPDIRWHRCDLKVIALTANVLAKQAAAVAGAYEAVMVRDGLVTEGASTNTFAVMDGVIRTHPAGPHILGGITRTIVLEIARQVGYPVEEKPFTVEQLYRASEAFLTSTRNEVLAITRVDGKVIADGRAGPVSRRLLAAFWERVAQGE